MKIKIKANTSIKLKNFKVKYVIKQQKAFGYPKAFCVILCSFFCYVISRNNVIPSKVEGSQTMLMLKMTYYILLNKPNPRCFDFVALRST